MAQIESGDKRPQPLIVKWLVHKPDDGNSGQIGLLKWLKTLTADCAVQESDGPHLRNEGHVQYFYVKEMGG